MSSRREVVIRILALLQRKTLIETKNRTLKCLKLHYLTVQMLIPRGQPGGGGGWAQVELTDALSRINRCKKFTLFRPF